MQSIPTSWEVFFLNIFRHIILVYIEPTIARKWFFRINKWRQKKCFELFLLGLFSKFKDFMNTQYKNIFIATFSTGKQLLHVQLLLASLFSKLHFLVLSATFSRCPIEGHAEIFWGFTRGWNIEFVVCFAVI